MRARRPFAAGGSIARTRRAQRESSTGGAESAAAEGGGRRPTLMDVCSRPGEGGSAADGPLLGEGVVVREVVHAGGAGDEARHGAPVEVAGLQVAAGLIQCDHIADGTARDGQAAADQRLRAAVLVRAVVAVPP